MYANATRMHSSRMCTVRNSSCLRGGVCSRGVSAPGGWYPSMHWGRPTPCGQTDTYKNITFATSLWTVKTLPLTLSCPHSVSGTITKNFLAYIGFFILYPHWTQSQVPGLPVDATVSVGKVSLTSGNIDIENSHTNPFICVWWISLEPENRTFSIVNQGSSFPLVSMLMLRLAPLILTICKLM